MTKFIAVIGGKGGVGKTTTSINLGTALSKLGKDVTVVDVNLTTPNVGVHLGTPVVPIHLNHVLQGRHHITEAVYEHPSGVKIIPASISIYDLKRTNPNNLNGVLRGLIGLTDIVLLDCAAGLGKEALLAMDAADDLLIVTNAELPAITDALKTIKLGEQMGKKTIGVVVTKSKKGDMISINNIETILDHNVIGIIPEDNSVLEALAQRDSVILTHPKSVVSVAYTKLAYDLIGRKYKEERKGFFSRLFGK